MAKTLHILRNLDIRLCQETLNAPAGDSVLLIQDGVLGRDHFDCEVRVCRDDLTARNMESSHKALSYTEIKDLMLAHDRVILW
ncbi:MAG: hypothetical protein ACE5FN_03275 [Leptospirillia bacterium]